MANWAPVSRGSVLYFHWCGGPSHRHFAESQNDSPAIQRKLKEQHEQQECSDLLALAEKIDDVVRHRQSCRKAQHPQRVPSPDGSTAPTYPRKQKRNGC